jgi:L-rhamnose-H+ transport protein
MQSNVELGAGLAVVSGIMNGLFTMPMRFLGRWSWENVWSVFIVGACLLLPAAVVSLTAPASWTLLLHAPHAAVWIALLTGFAWGFGAIMFGQSVSAIGIAMANTLVLAISSALGSLLPMLILSPAQLHERSGHFILLGIGVELVGIALCGRAGALKERASAVVENQQRGDLVGKRRTLPVALLLVCGSGLLSAVFNIGFALAAPIIRYGEGRGLSTFAATNMIWVVMLGGGAIANLVFCGVLMVRNRSASKLLQNGMPRLFGLGLLMSLLWGGSIFVYGAAAPALGRLGTSIGWPLSLAAGLLVANAVGLLVGEWRGSPAAAVRWMGGGIAVLLLAILTLSRAS